MTSVRAAKSKGAQMEYNTQFSLNEAGYNFFRTSERGFQLQYDLQDDNYKAVIECKFLKTITWNQAKAFFLKLCSKAPENYETYLIYKTNQQPVLVMYNDEEKLVVAEFEDVFNVPFLKHPSTRNR